MRTNGIFKYGTNAVSRPTSKSTSWYWLMVIVALIGLMWVGHTEGTENPTGYDVEVTR